VTRISSSKRRPALRSTLRSRRKPHNTRALPRQPIAPPEDLTEQSAIPAEDPVQRKRIKAAHRARRDAKGSLRFGMALRRVMRAAGRASIQRTRRHRPWRGR